MVNQKFSVMRSSAQIDIKIRAMNNTLNDFANLRIHPLWEKESEWANKQEAAHINVRVIVCECFCVVWNEKKVTKNKHIVCLRIQQYE